MKRILCLIAALLLCVAVAGSALAAGNTFVPSIGYKDGPESESAQLNKPEQEEEEKKEDVSQCVVVSSISDAKEKTTDITQAARDLLLEVYDKLQEVTMELPVIDDSFVIRELVDVSFKQAPCIGAEHIHEEVLKKEGVTITVVFDLGVKAGAKVQVFSYHNGQWDEAESVVNNGDGTVSCVLEHFCPVAFCVEAEEPAAPPATGDTMGENLVLWITLMAISCVGILLLVVFRRKSEE